MFSNATAFITKSSNGHSITVPVARLPSIKLDRAAANQDRFTKDWSNLNDRQKDNRSYVERIATAFRPANDPASKHSVTIGRI